VNELINQGLINEEESRHHPRRNEITKALGVGEDSVPDFYSYEATPGSKLLLCTDGIVDLILDDEINDIVNGEKDLQAACDKLVELANDRGGYDNITVILLEI
jgi:protein phosphatase